MPDHRPADAALEQQNLGDWLALAPYRLVLSSGFFGFFAHTGLLVALEEAGLRPSATAGSSAGALVGGLWASGLDGRSIREALLSLAREDFWDPGVGLGNLRPSTREGLGPGLLRGGKFRRKLESLLGARTFEACRVPLSVSTHDILARRTLVLDRTSPGLSLAAAIHASCAVPLLFQPVWVGRRPLCDGGVSDRPGMAGVCPTERVLHHHLASRSPWRRLAPRPPKRQDLVALVLAGLPRSGPFRLEAGREAMGMAQRAASRALTQPVRGRLDLQA
ncbi:MAG: patatin-like phospholipase family protein [Polyangia bacterium]|jgi:NTE family protein|nr:patatin-like phospholipase family protein [Polyangia bacterium]